MSNLCDAFKTLLDSISDDVPRHPQFPHVYLPPSCEAFAKAVCEKCAQGETHRTYRRGRFKEPLESQYELPLKLWEYSQWALEHLHRLFYGVPAVGGSGSPWNAEGSLNFADGVGWEVIGVSGDVITCRVPGWDGYDFDKDNPGARVLYSYRFMPEDSIYYTTAHVKGPVMPGDIVEVTDRRSALFNKVWPTVVSVLGVDLEAGTISLQLNMSVSYLLWNADVNSSEGDWLESVTVTTWRRAGNLARKLYIVPEAKMKVRRVPKVLVLKADDIPADGRIILTNSAGGNCRIPPYDPGDPDRGIPANFVVEAIVNGSRQDWSTILAPGNGRTFVDQIEGTYRTTVCVGTIDWKGEETLVDMRGGIQELVIRYKPEASAAERSETGVNTSWEYHCAGRCAHAVEVPGNGNYNMPFGSGTDSNGKRWYCKVRRYFEQSLTDNDHDGKYEWTPVWYIPKAPNCLDPELEDMGGAKRFLPECSQIGTCTHYTRIDQAGAGQRPFSLRLDGPAAFRGMLIAAPYKLTQLLPGFPYFVWGVPPEGQESLASLVGVTLGLTSRPGYHPLVLFPGYGFTGAGEWSVEVDDDGNHSIKLMTGFNWDVSTTQDDLAEVDWEDPQTYPGPGVFKDLEVWGARRNPLTGSNIGDTEDPRFNLRKHFDGVGHSIQPDTGQIMGHGLDERSELGTSDVALYAEAIQTGEYWLNKTQIRGDVAVTFFSSPQTVRTGFQAGMRIDVLRLITGGRNFSSHAPLQLKGAVLVSEMQAVRTAVIDRVISLGSGRFRFVLRNQPRVWSYTVPQPFGGSYEVFVHYESGDHFFSLPDFLRPDDYHDPMKRKGDGWDRARIGDAVRIDKDTTDVPNLRNMAFTIVDGGASSPDYIADDWGEERLQSSAPMIGGVYDPDPNTLRRDLNDDGVIDSNDIDPTTGGYSRGGIRTPTATTAAAASSSAFFIQVESECSFPANSFIRNRRTGEIAQINSWASEPTRMAVTRGVLDTEAEAVEVGDVWELVHVVGWDSDTNAAILPVYTRIPGDERPATLNAGEYWISPLGVFHFSQADCAAEPPKKIALFWAAEGQPDTPAFSYSATNVTLGLPRGYEGPDPANHRLPHVYPGFSVDQDGTWIVRDDSTGQVFSYAGNTRTPAKGSYGKVEEDGVTVLYFHCDDTGGLGRVVATIIETGNRNTEGPGEISYVPGFSTYGRAQDWVDVVCEGGFIDLIKDGLEGTQISLLCGAQVFEAKIPTLKAGKFREELTRTSGEDTVLSQHGMGSIWATWEEAQAIRSVGEKICLEVS